MYTDICKISKKIRNSVFVITYYESWNNRPSYDEKIADFAIFGDTTGKVVDFDITGIVKDWYTNGKNYGVMIKDSTEEGHYNEFLASSCDNAYASYRPQILITYVNYNGLEDFWTYHNQNIGRAGTAYVNDYNGNLILTKDMAQTYGNRMPAVLTHVYNSNDKDTDIGYGYGFRLNYHQTVKPVTIGSTAYYEYVDEDGTADYFYIDENQKWIDETGIQLTLTIGTGTEDMYTITDKNDQKLIFGSDSYLRKIVDANSNTLTVSWNGGKISKITDGVGRTLTLTYTSGVLASIIGPDGTVTLAYGGGMLSLVTDVDGRKFDYVYDARRLLIAATNIDGYQVSFDYTAQAPYRVVAVSETDGNRPGQSYQVAYGDNINQFTDDKGRKELYMFNDSGHTVCIKNDDGYAQSYKYLTSGKNKNRLSNVSKLQYTGIQKLKNPNVTSLDNWGHYASASGITATLNQNAANARVGVTSLQLTSTVTSGRGDFYQNVTVEKGKAYVFSAYVKAAQSMIDAGKCFVGVEMADSAGARSLTYFRTCVPMGDGWYLMEAPFTVPTSAASASVAVAVGMTDTTGTAYFDCMQLEDGEVCSRYNMIENNDFSDGLTDFSKSQTMDMFDGIIDLSASEHNPKAVIASGLVTADALNVRSGPGTGYGIVASVTAGKRVHILGSASDSAGTVWYAIAFSVDKAVRSGYVSSAWVNKDKPTVYVNRGMVNTDSLNVRSGAGTGYGALGLVARGMEVDILENITSAAGQVWYFVTYLYNGTRYSGCVLSDYIKTFASLPAGPSVPAKHGPMDSKVLRITGEGDKAKKLTQTLKVSGTAGDVYVVNAWGAADCVPIKDKRTFGTEVIFVNTDGTQDTFNSNFGAAVSDWQYLSDVVVAKKAYSAIQVSLIYGYNANAAYFDGLSFFKEQFGQSFTYDEKGNVLSSQDAAKQAESYEYDSNNNMTKLVDAKGRNFKYTYDSRHNVTSSVSAANCKCTFSYDTYGNPTEGRTVNPANENEYIRTTAEYTANGNQIAKVTDALGYSMAYAYNQQDILTSETDAAGHTLTYDYNAMNQLTSMMKDVTVNGQVLTPHVGFGYVNDRLSVIAQNDFIYNMAYDSFGNLTSTSVEDQAIQTYVYEANNGNVKSKTYGNGVTLSYTYDVFDRVIATDMASGSNSAVRIYEYSYDHQGNLAVMKDLMNRISYRYFYDMTDRLVMCQDSLGNSFTYIYDANNNLTSMTVKNSGTTLTTQYVYDADDRETQTQAKSKTLTTAYDALGRLDTKTWNTGTPFVTKYHYMAGANGSQSSQVASVDIGSQKIAYTYDGNGNITSITDSQGTTTYAYDELNRLVRENNHQLCKTVTYLYDAAGNIQKKYTYALTNEQNLPASPEAASVYAYDDVWRDKLVSVDGKAITYDAIGNPLTYGAWSMEWTQGKRLASMNSGDGGNTLMFTYDESGMRLSKLDFAGNKNHKYTIAGDKLTGERCENMDGSVLYTTQFVYDSAGEAVSMVYNGVEYYFVRNGQRDVVGLIDGNGNIVVNYTYDSWGKLLKVEGNTELGYRNPLRYRGYIADDETGLYYVGSRYYDPVVGRWISADDVAFVGLEKNLQSYNVYGYCLNNPITRFDDNGKWSLPNWAKIALGVTAIVAGVVVTAVTGGVAAPVLAASIKIAAVGAASGAIFGAGIGAVEHRASTGSWKGAGKSILKGAIDGACDGFMWSGISAGAAATGVALKGYKIKEIGRLKPSGKSGKGYYGVKYGKARTRGGNQAIRSIELHSPHAGGKA